MTSTAATSGNSRVLIVTGASSGIGAALAAYAAARRWSVVLVARRADRVESLAAGIRSSGGNAAALACDVTAKDAPVRIVETALHAFGRIDVVVNNAGFVTIGAMLEQSDALIEGQWQLHVAGPLRIARAALPHVRATKGGLVFLGSGVARVPVPFYGAYCAAKAAARATATQLRRELRRDGVFVTYVDPGVVDTNFSQTAGLVSKPAVWHGTPDAVAGRILDGIEHRASRVNAIPWQTAATIVGEWFPWVADAAMDYVVNGSPVLENAPATTKPDTTHAALDLARSPFEAALEPVARRMERVKLSAAFVRDLLQEGSTVALHDAAMRWAGMPNKNERAAMHEVLQALADAGYLEPVGDETWKVLRAPE